MVSSKPLRDIITVVNDDFSNYENFHFSMLRKPYKDEFDSQGTTGRLGKIYL